jgi:hypothetical protein
MVAPTYADAVRICRALATWQASALVVGLAFTPACGGGSRSACAGQVRQAIFGGGTASVFLELGERAVSAVVFLKAESTSAPCSGILTESTAVLTAAHCFAAGTVSDTVEVRFGADSSLPDAVLPGTLSSLDGTRDLAWVEVPDASDLAEPIRAAAPSDGPVSGEIVEMSGFGGDGRARAGHRRFLATRIIAIGDDLIAVESDGLSGACAGDSGGPLLARSPKTLQPVVLGVLSEGSTECTGPDSYARLPATLETPSSFDLAPNCAGLTEEGRCFAGSAAWCDDGEFLGNDCASEGSVCGWSSTEHGYRCLDLSDDACAGIPELGACRDRGAVRCMSGVIEDEPCTCAPCGFAPLLGGYWCSG